MFYKLPDIRNIDVKGKTVFLRGDLDVPVQKFKVTDESRLIAGMPTIKYLLNNGANVFLAGHLGRPAIKIHDSGFKIQEEFSLEPIAKWYLNKFNPERSRRTKFKVEKTKIGEFWGWKLAENFFLLENLRFYKEEEANDSEFSKKLASLGEIYVNDAFAVSHRLHSSIVGVTKFIPHFAGLRLLEEVKTLSTILEKPARPMVVLIGGEKVETKLPLVLKMYELADYVLVGGKIAGGKKDLKSACDKTTHKCKTLIIAELNKEETDITEKDITNFKEIISLAKTIVWNGPMGLLSSKLKVQSSKLNEDTEKGTKEIAKTIAGTNAYKVVGGGDTIDFLRRINLLDKFDFVSTGGGAMLAFLSGEKLPGLEALIH